MNQIKIIRAGISMVWRARAEQPWNGGTPGYQIKDNIQLTIAYISGIIDKDPGGDKMNAFRVTLVWMAKMMEGMRRLKEND